jgi:PAS domain S-box-containing protein
MAWQVTSYAIPYAVVAVAMVTIGSVVHRRRTVAGARPLTLLSFAIALWAGANVLVIARTGLPGMRVFSNLSYLAIATIPVIFFHFSVEYTGHDLGLTRYGLWPLFVLPAITQVVVWTNTAHGLMWSVREASDAGAFNTLSTEHAIWFEIHSVYSYLLLVLGTYVLVRTLITSDESYRGQAVALLGGAFAPWITNALFITDILEAPFDPTPIAFSVTAVGFLVAIYRHRILEMVPVARELARDELMDNLAEPVFILDDRQHVSDLNPAAATLLGMDPETAIGEPLTKVFPDLGEELTTGTDETVPDGGASMEVALRQGGSIRHYDVRVTELRRGGGFLNGHLVSLRDVNERRQREQRLDVLNRALRHDLRNEANVILGYAELGMEKHPDAEWVAAIQEHIEGMVDLSHKVRQIERALDHDDVVPRPVEVVELVGRVVETVESERPDVDIETTLPDEGYVSVIDLFDEAVHNALENAVEHNDNPAPLVEVSVTVSETDDGEVSIEIRDNGPGIHDNEREVLLRGRETQLDHISGLGLWIVNWIVTESGGRITFSDNEPRGSVVELRVPMAEPPSDDDRPAASDGRDADSRGRHSEGEADRLQVKRDDDRPPSEDVDNSPTESDDDRPPSEDVDHSPTESDDDRPPSEDVDHE